MLTANIMLNYVLEPIKHEALYTSDQDLKVHRTISLASSGPDNIGQVSSRVPVKRALGRRSEGTQVNFA